MDFLDILNCKQQTFPQQKVTFVYAKLAQKKLFDKKVLTVFKLSVNLVTSSGCIKLIDQ